MQKKEWSQETVIGSENAAVPDLRSLVHDDLRSGGTLSLLLPGYEERPPQAKMAQIVARAITENVPALIEAPTGTGKGIAYLIPVIRSGMRTVISTSTKILQEELFAKELAFVKKHLGVNCSAVVVKGSSNYLCLARVEDARSSVAGREPSLKRLLSYLAGTEPEGFDGDMEALPFSLEEDTRKRVQFDGIVCSWEHCPYYNDCYVRKVREASQKADILIINHTLLMLDAVKSGFILPKGRELLVIDEGHALEEEAIRAFTVSVTPRQITSLLDLQLIQEYGAADAQESVRVALNAAWAQLSAIEVREPNMQTLLPPAMPEGLVLAQSIRDLGESLKSYYPVGMSQHMERLYKKLIARTQLLSEIVHFVFSADRTNPFVYYLEHTHPGKGPEQICLFAAPLKVSGLLKTKLFDANLTICTSATLTTIDTPQRRPIPLAHLERTARAEPTFAYFRRTTGWGARQDGEECLEYILPSSFHYRDQALLYLPCHLPEPRYDDEIGKQKGDVQEAYVAYIRAIAKEMTRLVLASQGRAFLLFTSRKMMEEVYAIMQSGTALAHLNLLLQGSDQTRKEMLRSFRETKSVLFGLRSFTEGVDIAGEMLSLVVVAKLPFPYPDPVYEAKRQMMETLGEDWFAQYVLPQVILRLKQSLGRLIRTSKDRGVMAILDQRMHSRSYGTMVLSSLPKAKVTSRFEDVARFFSVTPE